MTEGYKQTEIGVIPEDWEVKQIREFAKICMCKRIFADQTADTGDIPFYKIGTFGNKPDAYIPRALYNEYRDKYSFPKTGDILISAAGTLGRTVVFNGSDSYYQDSNIVWLDIDKRVICNEYLKHYYKVIQWAASEGSTISRLYNGIIESTYVALPPLHEQQRIAEALSDMDELIASLEKLIAKKKAIKQGAMQELLTGKCRLPGFSGEWKRKLFGDLFEICPNNAYTRDQLTIGGKIKNIHYGDILTKYGAYLDGSIANIPSLEKSLEKKKYADKAFVQGGDVIIADTAEDLTVGKAVEIVNVSGKILSGQHTFLCRPIIPFAPKYLGYYLNSADFHDQFVPYVTGTKVSSINRSSLCSLTVIYPDIPEQSAIAEILSDTDKAILALEERLVKASQIKQGMMQQLLTGKIRIV